VCSKSMPIFSHRWCAVYLQIIFGKLNKYFYLTIYQHD